MGPERTKVPGRSHDLSQCFQGRKEPESTEGLREDKEDVGTSEEEDMLRRTMLRCLPRDRTERVLMCAAM